jgi:hypothetical protein
MRGQVRAGIAASYSRHLPRRLGIHSSQHPVRVRASHHVRVRLPRLVQVVRVAAFAAEEGRVFSTADGFADGWPNGARDSASFLAFIKRLVAQTLPGKPRRMKTSCRDPRCARRTPHLPAARERVANYHRAAVQQVHDAVTADDIVVVGMRNEPVPEEGSQAARRRRPAEQYLETAATSATGAGA